MIKKQSLAMLTPDKTKIPVPEAIVAKYGLQVGSKAPFSGLPIVALGRELTEDELAREQRAAEMQKMALTLRREAEAKAEKKKRTRKTTKETAAKKRVTKKKKASTA